MEHTDWDHYIKQLLKDPAIKEVSIGGWDRSGYGWGRPALPLIKIQKFTLDDLAEKLAEKKLKDDTSK